MVCGGVDSCISPLAMMGFARARALSTKYNDKPHKASRPFDVGRDGFVMGEGAGVMVMEREEHAKKRGARIYCELAGYGSSGDAGHVTSAREDGSGAVEAMEAALHEAGVQGEDVWSVNAHATSTPLGDRAECNALRQVVGDQCLVTSNKGSIGHLLGAAGAVESVFSVLSVVHNLVPPCTNLELPDKEVVEGLRLVVGEATTQQQRQPGSRRTLLKNSFGFGGTNVSLVFRSLSG